MACSLAYKKQLRGPAVTFLTAKVGKEVTTMQTMAKQREAVGTVTEQDHEGTRRTLGRKDQGRPFLNAPCQFSELTMGQFRGTNVKLKPDDHLYHCCLGHIYAPLCISNST